MLFTQQLLVKFHFITLGLIIVSVCVALSMAGLFLVRRFVPHHRLKMHHDVTGPMFGTIGVIYAVLLAFVVIVVWQDFDKTKLNVEKEANCLADLYWDADGLGSTAAQGVHLLAREYADLVVNKEWKLLDRAESSPEVSLVLRKLEKIYSSNEPASEKEKIFLAESVRKINELDNLRMSRLLDAKSGVQPVLWFILIAGGVITIAFAFLFGAESLRVQMTMSIMLALLISLILFTILLLDFPFTGAVHISPAPFMVIFTA